MVSKPAGSYVDTDVILKLITHDDFKKQAATAKLFEETEKGDLVLSAPDTVIADAVFVLSSPRLYNFPRVEIRDVLMALLRLTNFRVDNKQAVITALDFYANSTIDFGDALLIALTLKTKTKEIYSYDRDFDKFAGIKRKEP
ncbi:MAG: PIN domain-containing protein [Candidatus Daviesbacteria bacterium]|nr:PIN domain-containing protein [Candidatus Daviesbacteria bacterium]